MIIKRQVSYLPALALIAIIAGMFLVGTLDYKVLVI